MSKKVLLYTPWNNRWKGSLAKAFKKGGWEPEWMDGSDQTTSPPDAILFMWSDALTINTSREVNAIPMFTFIRHYEVYTDMPGKVNWKNIKGLFFCAPHVQQIANQKWPQLSKVPQYVIPNWVDPEEWPLREGFIPNKRIAMVGRLHPAKNYPMALQIIKALPEDYTLDVAGGVQDESLVWYLQHLCKEMSILHRVAFHGEVEDIKGFLQDKTFILNTSYREGCPMAVLEACSMGLVPIVHNWMGAKEFYKTAFKSPQEAVDIIKSFEIMAPELNGFWIDYSKRSARNADRIVEVVNAG